MNIFKKLLLYCFLLLVVFSLNSCVFRDNPNDQKNPNYSVSARPTAGNGATIVGHEDLIIQFSDSMNTSSITLGGSLLGTINADYKLVWSNTSFSNDTLTVTQFNTASPVRFWPKGAVTLTVQGTTTDGIALPLTTMNFTVVYQVFVHSTSGGDTSSYTGTRAKPYGSIQYGINKAKTIYTTYATDVVDVHVAAGTYSSAGVVITMTEGISVYGGYSASDWSVRSNNPNTTSYETVVEDTRTTLGSSETNPNRAVEIGAGISRVTVVDGFTIKMAKGGSSASIFCQSSPTITNNRIIGRETGDIISTTYNQIGISFSGSSNALVQKNIIDPKYSYSTGNFSYGLYISGSSPEINDNYSIKGGNGGYTYAVYIVSSSNPQIIYNDLIDTGTGSSEGICISIAGTSHPSITDNIFTKSASLTIHGIYETTTNDNPSSVRRNDFNYTGNWYRDAGGSTITDDSYSSSVSTVEGNENLFNSTGWNNKSTLHGIN